MSTQIFDLNSGTQNVATQAQTQQSGLQNLATNGVNNQANTYTAPQSALQGQTLGNYSNYLQNGQIPLSFGMPTAVQNFANNQFTSNTAPQLAAQFGPDSPQIGLAQQNLDLGLAAQANQLATGNYLNAQNAASNYAFTPVGVQAANNSAQVASNSANSLTNQNQATNYNSQTLNGGGLLSTITSLLGGPFSGSTNPAGP